jgi:hypothetical protein
MIDPMHAAWDQFCTDLRQLREAGSLSEAQLDQIGEEAERLHNAGRLSNDQVEQLVEASLSEDDLALIDGIAYGLAKLINTPLGDLAAEAGVPRTSSDWLTGDEVRQTISASAARLANTSLDQLAAEARAIRARKAREAQDFVRDAPWQHYLQKFHHPGLAGHGVVLQNPHDPPDQHYATYEVRWLRGYPLPQLPPVIDGYPVQLVVVDSLPVPYAL